MAKGNEDFFQPVIVAVSTDITAFDELAARLNSPYIGHRLGQVVFLDNFENGIGNWAIAGTGVGATAAQVTDKAHSVSASAKLTTGTAAGSTASITHSIGKFESEFYGLEIWFARLNTMEMVEVIFGRRDGAVIEQATVRCDRSDDEVQYQQADVSYQQIFDYTFSSDGVNNWHRIKLVVDFDNGLYKKIWFDDQLFEDSVAMNSAASALTPLLFCSVKMTDTLGSQEDGWVDNVAMTINDVGE